MFRVIFFKGENEIEATNVNWIDINTLSFSVDFSNAEYGYWDLKIINNDGYYDILRNAILVEPSAPEIVNIFPRQAFLEEGTITVEINGENFIDISSVSLIKGGQQTAGTFEVVDENNINAYFNISNLESGYYRVKVVGNYGEDISDQEILLLHDIEIDYFAPSSCYSGETVTITITGSGFHDVSNVYLRSGSALYAGNIQDKTSTQIIASFGPIESTGLYDLELVDIYDQIEEIKEAFSVLLQILGPTIISISPTEGGMNKQIIIQGINFGEGKVDSKIMFTKEEKSHEAEIVSWSDTRIVCYSPEVENIGEWDVFVMVVNE